MPTRKLIDIAFGSRAWTDAMEAWYAAIGVSVVVLDSESATVVSTGPRVGLCGEAAGGPQGTDAPFGCIEEGSLEGICHGGTRYMLVPVPHEGRVVARLLVCGYVCSNSERRRLSGCLERSGVPGKEARALLRGIPVIPKRRTPAIADMVLRQAVTVLSEAEAEAHAEEADRFIDALGSAMEGGRSADAEGLPHRMLSRCLELLRSPSGALSLVDPETDKLGKVVRVGESTCCTRDLLTQTVTSRSSSVQKVTLGDGTTRALTLAPLRIEARVVGALCVEESGVETESAAVGLLERFAAFAAVILDVATRRERRERELLELMQVSEFAMLVGGASDPTELSHLVVDVLEKAIALDVGGLMLTAFGADSATIVANRSLEEPVIRSIVGEAVGRHPEESWELRVLRLAGVDPPEEALDEHGFTVLSEPLLLGDSVVGFLFAARKASLFDRDDQRLVQRLADHAAVALSRSALLDRLHRERSDTLELFAMVLDASERMGQGHAGRVMELSMAIGLEMGLSREDVELLRFAGLVHDIGKVGVTDEILLKPSRLSESEMEEVRRHAQFGASLVEQVAFLETIAPIVRHHHERWDGDGYPAGLAGERIPLLARILGAADAYVSMTSQTPYRSALEWQAAEAEMLSGAGGQFDPDVVSALMTVLRRSDRASMSGLLGPTTFANELPA